MAPARKPSRRGFVRASLASAALLTARRDELQRHLDPEAVGFVEDELPDALEGLRLRIELAGDGATGAADRTRCGSRRGVGSAMPVFTRISFPPAIATWSAARHSEVKSQCAHRSTRFSLARFRAEPGGRRGSHGWYLTCPFCSSFSRATRSRWARSTLG